LLLILLINSRISRSGCDAARRWTQDAIERMMLGIENK